MNLAHLLSRQARVSADRPAIFEGAQPWSTHAQWAQRSAAMAPRLRAAGLEPGDRMLVFMRNHPRYLEIRRRLFEPAVKARVTIAEYVTEASAR